MNESPEPAELKSLVRGGAKVLAVAQAVSQVLSLVILATLLRLLLPDVHGLLAMILPAATLLRNLSGLGLNVATTQARTVTHEECSALFWWNLTGGVVSTALLAALAPVLAWFYHLPELLPLTLVMSGTQLLAAIPLQHQAMLERKMQFRAVVLARLAGQLLGGVAAIVVAWQGGGVWALVVQQYLELGLLALGICFASGWRPAWRWSKQPIEPLVRVGTQFTLANGLFFLTMAIDKVALGYLKGDRALGLYGQAFNLMLKPVYILTTPLAGLVVPAMTHAREAPETREALFVGLLRVLALMLFPAGIGLTLVAPETMLVLGGEPWREAGPLLTALGPAILVQGVVNILAYVLTGLGHTGRVLTAGAWMVLACAIAYALGYLIGDLWQQPSLGLALGYSCVMLVVIGPLYLHSCLRLLGISWSKAASALWPSLWRSLLMGLAVWALRFGLLQTGTWRPKYILIACMACGVVVYALFSLREAHWAMNQFRTLKKSKD